MIDIESYKTKVHEKVGAGMLDCLTYAEDCGYSKKDIQKCENLLLRYLEALNKIKKPDDEYIMKQVKKVVLALNKFDEKIDHWLNEALVCEEIWQIIQDSAIECGLTSYSDDITGEWRDW